MLVIASLFLAVQAMYADSGPELDARRAIDVLLAGTFGDASVDVAEFRDALRRYECVTPAGTRVSATTIAGDGAVVDVIATATATLPITHVSEEFPPHWRVHLRGGRVIRIASAERELAALLAAAEPEAQRALLDECETLATPELVRQLVVAGLALGSKGQFAREERLATIALGIADELRDANSRARVLWLLGRANDMQEAYDDALLHYDEAFRLAEANGDRETAGRALVGRGWVHVSRYEYAQAQEPLARGLAIALGIGDFMIADNAYLATALMHQTSGDYVKALRDLDLARGYAEKAGDRVVVAAATGNAGMVFSWMNNDELAAQSLREAIRLYHDLGNERGEMRNLRNLADIEAAVRDPETAARYLDRVDEYLSRQPNDRMAAFAATTRATIARHRHDFAAADRELFRARELATKTGELRLVAILTNTLSEVRLEQGRTQEAADLAEKAVEMSLTSESEFELYATAKLNAGRAYRKLGRAGEAEEALRAAVDSVERMLANVPATEEEQQNFFHDKTPSYYELFRLFAEQHRTEEAIEWVERARSRTLIEFLGRNQVSADRNILSPDERDQEMRLQQDLVSLNRTLRELRTQPAIDAKRIGEVEVELRQKRLVLQDFTAHLFSRHPELALSRGALPRPSLAEIQKLIPPNGAIVEYVAAADALSIIVISHEGLPYVTTVDFELRDLTRRVETFADRIARRDLGIHSDGRAFYKLLLAPVESLLRSKTSLCIIPDGPLWRIPFPALVDRRGRYLVERNSVFYAPSLSLLAWYANHSRTPIAKPKLLALGNPRFAERTAQIARATQRNEALIPLPDAEYEVRELGAFYGANATILIGAEATEARFKRDAGRYRFIHIATHATFEDALPLYSHLALAAPGDSAEDGLLEAREIMNLDLAADLVVLSSCETGRGAARGGDGLTGMSWALLVAGCPTAVLSQWKVGSASTAKLMIEFHRRLARIPPNDRRQAAARALRGAQLTRMRTRQYRHPYDWSAFMVVGNGW